MNIPRNHVEGSISKYEQPWGYGSFLYFLLYIYLLFFLHNKHALSNSEGKKLNHMWWKSAGNMGVKVKAPSGICVSENRGLQLQMPGPPRGRN